jgi:hypothetical protein
MNVSSLQSASGVLPLHPLAQGAQAKSIHDLTKAVRTGDLDGAKQAYADIVKAAPDGATLTRGGAFAQLGRALASGDLDSAKTIIVDAVKAARGNSTMPVPLPGPMPMAPDGGGSVNLTA